MVSCEKSFMYRCVERREGGDITLSDGEACVDAPKIKMCIEP